MFKSFEGGIMPNIEKEDSLDKKADKKKMSMFYEFFKNNPKARKIANAATMLIILTKGFLASSGAEAAETPRMDFENDSRPGIEFIADLESDFDKIEKDGILPDGSELKFKSYSEATGDDYSQEIEGELEDKGGNIIVCSYIGGASFSSGDDLNSNYKELVEIGSVEGEVEKSGKTGCMGGIGTSRAEALVDALRAFSEYDKVHIIEHEVAASEAKESNIEFSSNESFGSRTRQSSLSYVHSYEIVDETVDDDNVYYVKVNIIGGELAEVEKNI